MCDSRAFEQLERDGVIRMRAAWRNRTRTLVMPIMASAAVLVVLIAVVAVRLATTDHRGRQHASAASVSTVALDQPYQVGSDFRCLTGLPVRAFADHTSYPPGHPASPPLTRRPVRCYATAGQAAAAGYPQGPLPPGTLELGGIYLAPVAPGLAGRCRQAARRLGFAVPCPELLPTEQPGRPGASACQPPLQDCTPLPGTFLLDDQQLIVPPGYVGVDRQPQGHLVIVAAASPANPSVNCYGAQRIATPHIHGMPAVLVTCQPASETHGGHVLLRVALGRTTVAVSLHGWSTLNQQLVVQLAQHLRLVPPPPTS